MTEAQHAAAMEKAARLLRHDDEIQRIRLDLEYDPNRSEGLQYLAKGHVEVGGSEVYASVASEEVQKSLDFLIQKLDTRLRRLPARVTH